MTLFETLLLAHLLGDWILQTEWQAVNKTRNWAALFAHVAVYHLIVLGVLALRLGLADARVYLAVGFLAVSHAILDRRTMTLTLMRRLRIVVQRQSQTWLTMAVDQSIHILLIGLVTLYLS